MIEPSDKLSQDPGFCNWLIKLKKGGAWLDQPSRSLPAPPQQQRPDGQAPRYTVRSDQRPSGPFPGPQARLASRRRRRFVRLGRGCPGLSPAVGQAQHPAGRGAGVAFLSTSDNNSGFFVSTWSGVACRHRTAAGPSITEARAPLGLPRNPKTAVGKCSLTPRKTILK